VTETRERRFQLGAAITLAELEGELHPALARLRAEEPVSWLPALGAWLVTRRDLALRVMRDPEIFTVDDPRFSTGRAVGPSMLTRDGGEHERHRAPFARPFRLDAVRKRFATVVRGETDRLIDPIEPAGRAELRRALAGPLAVVVVAHALGLGDTDSAQVLRWYDAIVDAVSGAAARRPITPEGLAAVDELRERIGPALDADPDSSLLAAAAAHGGLTRDEVLSNAAVLMFGGIETTEGMIANAILHLLQHPDELALVEADRSLLAGAVDESLRLEPAAAVIDRYATRDAELDGAAIADGDLVTVSLAGANRDPAFFPEPDRFDVRRANARHQVAFAHGPHVCIGMHLARLEVHTALARLLDRLPRLRLDPERPASARGLVFRKPPALHVVWDRWENPGS
jgi:cytochrome P450